MPEISLQKSPHQQVLHVLLQGIKRPSWYCIVHIPRLRDVGMRGVELTNEREDPNDIHNHGQGIPRGQNFLSVQEAAQPIHIVHHQSGS